MSAVHEEKNPIVEALESSYNDPALFAMVLLRVPRLRQWQLRVCREIRKRLDAGQTNVSVVIRACRGVGKTYFAAVLLLWWMTTRFNSRGLTTAPGWSQVVNVLWPEVKRLYNRSMMRDVKFGRILTDKLDFGETWFAIGHASDNPANLEGHHSDVAAIRIVDEAKAVEDGVFDYTTGMLTSPQNLDLWISTPSLHTGRFYERDVCSPEFDAVRIKVTLDEVLADASLTEGERRGLLNLRASILELCGGDEDAPLYRAQVMAEYADNAEGALFPSSWVERAMKQPFEVWAERAAPIEVEPLVLGMDVAGSVAGDLSAIAVAAGPDGNDRVEVKWLGAWSESNTMVSKGKALEAARRFSENYGRPVTIRVDVIGIGKGVHDQLATEGANVQPYNAATASKRPGRFFNRKAEDAWALRERLEAGTIRLPNDQHLLAEMVAMKYEITTQGKIKVVDPKDSPDRLDAVLIACAPERPSVVGIKQLPTVKPQQPAIAGPISLQSARIF